MVPSTSASQESVPISSYSHSPPSSTRPPAPNHRGIQSKGNSKTSPHHSLTAQILLSARDRSRGPTARPRIVATSSLTSTPIPTVSDSHSPPSSTPPPALNHRGIRSKGNTKTSPHHSLTAQTLLSARDRSRGPTARPRIVSTSSLTSTPIPTVSDSYPLLIPYLSSETQSAPQTSGKPTVIGYMGCWSGPEIGFILSKTHWGKGYASESLGALLDHLFSQTSIGSNVGDCPGPNLTLKADVDPRNERCLRLLKKFGFSECGREEKTFETHLGWCDSVYLDLTRERWVVWKGMAGRRRHERS